MNIFSNKILVRFVDSNKKLEIICVESDIKGPAIVLTEAMRRDMTFEEFASYIGGAIALCIPAIRKEFEDYLWSEDGTPPKRK
jgi:hypothetical protein